MQKIQKFQLHQTYSAPKSKKTFELIQRNSHYLIFQVRNPKDRISYKISATSVYKADENGAYEEILLQDGTRIRSDSGSIKNACTFSLAA
ncbi:MAG: hypothetical protein K6G79_08300 [Bacteroidales bacterium]|nr:hypothetical protein [Bacteroidales bacterium]